MVSKLGRKIRETVRRVGRVFNKTRKKVGRAITNVREKIQNIELFNQNPINSISDMTEMEQLTAKVSNQTYKRNREPFIGNYELKPEGTNVSTATYLNEQTDHIVIGFRGTKTIQDVITDYQLARGNELDTKRIKEDMEFFDKIVNTFNPRTITLTGHSLGANICLKINAQRGNVNNVIVFNPAINQNDIRNNFSDENKRNITIIRTPDDPISLLSALLTKANVKTLQIDRNKNLRETHSIDNFVN